MSGVSYFISKKLFNKFLIQNVKDIVKCFKLQKPKKPINE